MEYRRIIAPLDGSLMAEYVLPHVEALALALGAEVVLLHVLAGHQERPPTTAQRRAQADIGRYLEKMQEHLAKKGVQARWLVCYGDPAPEISRVVGEEQGDLVIMATHGKGEAKGKTMGSVASQTLERLSAPMLVMRPPSVVRSL